MKNVLLVFGTRPEAIKMAPLVKEFLKYPVFFNVRVCVTAQHREMLDQVLTFFEIIPDYDLNLMKPNQDLFALTSSIILGIKDVVADCRPDYVFIQGDTTTAMTAALGAFYSSMKICHIEAGLRTCNKYEPFPEEINRRLISVLADIHFAPTETAKNNLLSDGVKSSNVLVVGNTVFGSKNPGETIALLKSVK